MRPVGTALVAMNRWADARDAATTAAQENPTCAEAHLLLGQIHAHGGQWEQAAAEYRLAAESKN